MPASTSTNDNMPVADMLAQAHSWYAPDENTFTISYMPSEGTTKMQYRRVLKADVVSYDPNLAILLEALINQTNPADNLPRPRGFIEGTVVRANYHLWADQLVQVPRKDQPAVSVSGFYSVAAHGKRQVDLGCLIVSIHDLPALGRACVTKINLEQIRVPATFVDKNFPGWKERLAVATAMGMTHEDTMPYVLPLDGGKTVAATLDGISL